MGLNLRSYLLSPGMPFVPSPATHTSPSSPSEVSVGWSKCGIMNRKNTSSAGSLRRGLEFRVWPTTLKVFSSYPPVLGSKPKTDPNGSAFSCNSSRKVTWPTPHTRPDGMPGPPGCCRTLYRLVSSHGAMFSSLLLPLRTLSVLFVALSLAPRTRLSTELIFLKSM